MKWMTTVALVLTALCAQAQDTEGFTPTTKGTFYKIVPLGNGNTMPYGTYFEFSYDMRYQNKGKDSLLNSSHLTSNSIASLDTLNTPIYIYQIFAQCRKGDSVALKVAVDSAYAGGELPPGIEQGGFFYSTYRIINVFGTRTEADSVMLVLRGIAQIKTEARAKLQSVKDDQAIQDYLKANNIHAVKAAKGTYIETLVPGKGRKVDDKVSVQINYTGRTLTGSPFDSNTDPAFGHVEPFTVNMWAPEVIAGWIEGLTYFSQGMKGRLYIPSGMGYGEQGAGADIAPNAILVFDIEAVKVTPKPVAKVAPKAKVKAKPKPVVKKKKS